MMKEHYSYITPALATVAACSFCVYLIWRHSFRPASNQPSIPQVEAGTRNRRTETVVEDRSDVSLDKKLVQNSRFQKISSHGKTELDKLYDSPETPFLGSDELHRFPKASKAEISRHEKTHFDKFYDSQKKYTGTDEDCKAEYTDQREKSEPIRSEELKRSNGSKDVVTKNVSEVTGSETKIHEELKEICHQKLIGKAAENEKNQDTQLDLTQNCGPKNEDMDNKTLEDLPRNSESKNEVSEHESNKPINNKTDTQSDLTRNTGPKNEDIDNKTSEETTFKESNENHEVSRSDDIQTILSFLGITMPVGEEDLKRMFNNRKRWRRNPMYWALREGNLTVVESLMRLGASVDFIDKQGQYPTHLAATSGNIELLKILVRWGSNLSQKDIFGYIPLHRAALSGQTETVKWLYGQGCCVEETSFAGWTPLHLAVMNGHYDTCEQLLTFGAHVNAKDKDGWTPLYLAKLYKRKEIIILLELWGGKS